MRYSSNLALFCLITFLTDANAVTVPQSENSNWTKEPLCVLMAKEKCPTGFVNSVLRLSIQPDVNPKDKNATGEDLMKLGKAGNSYLDYEAYDRLYTLNLVVCCQE